MPQILTNATNRLLFERDRIYLMKSIRPKNMFICFYSLFLLKTKLGFYRISLRGNVEVLNILRDSRITCFFKKKSIAKRCILLVLTISKIKSNFLSHIFGSKQKLWVCFERYRDRK